jgi:formiminotetrahydrofolate cyclodeaminase
VVAAYKRPKAPTDEQAARAAAIQQALRGATDVPLNVLRQSAAALRLSTAIAAHGHRAAASDVGVAVALLRAGARGALLNVRINLESMSDAAYAAAVAAEAGGLANEAGRAADQADALL